VDPTTLGSELIKQLASQGLGWLLFSIACIVCYIFYQRQQVALENCASLTQRAGDLRDQLQEKRVDEARGYIKVFAEGTAANEKLAQAIAVRTETLQAVSAAVLQTQQTVTQMAELLGRVVSLAQDTQNDQNAREAAWQVRLGQIEEIVKKNAQRMDSLIDELRRAR
jgi:cell pole-organizing protein PopZ